MSETEIIRASQLPKLFPVLKRSAWAALISSGKLPSTRVTARIRTVRVDDVRALLGMTSTAEAQR